MPSAFDTSQRLELIGDCVRRVVARGGAVLDVGGYPGVLAQSLGDDYRARTVDLEPQQEGL